MPNDFSSKRGRTDIWGTANTKLSPFESKEDYTLAKEIRLYTDDWNDWNYLL